VNLQRLRKAILAAVDAIFDALEDVDDPSRLAPRPTQPSRRRAPQRPPVLPPRPPTETDLKVLLARLEPLLAALDASVILAPYDSVLLQHPLDERGARAVKLSAAEMMGTMRVIVPGTEPRIDINNRDTGCWNDEGRSNSIAEFLEELDR
jgi:hypothetical protein